MQYIYVDGASGANSNSGTTTGSALASGTSATRSTNVYTLDGSPDLSGVTVNQDYIRITGETSGSGYSANLFLITAVDDGADTVTVSPTPTGGTSGLTWVIGGAVATIQAGVDAVNYATTTRVYIKAGSGYTEQVDPRSGSIGSAVIFFTGYSATPGDGGKATHTGTTYCWSSAGVTGAANWVFENLIFTGASSYDLYLPNADYFTFHNCEIINAGAAGIIADNQVTLMKCIIANNTGHGVDLDNSSQLFGCRIYGNNGYQAYALNSYTPFIGNLVYGHTSTSSDMVVGQAIFYANTFDGEGTSASDRSCINVSGLTQVVLCNNIFHDFPVGVKTNAAIYANPLNVVGYNLSSALTYSTYSNEAWATYSDVSASPNFADEASDNYTLAADSAAIGAGLGPA